MMVISTGGGNWKRLNRLAAGYYYFKIVHMSDSVIRLLKLLNFDVQPPYAGAYSSDSRCIFSALLIFHTHEIIHVYCAHKNRINLYRILCTRAFRVFFITKQHKCEATLLIIHVFVAMVNNLMYALAVP